MGRSWFNFRLWLHVPVGLLNVVIATVTPMVALIFGAGFLIYEVTQGGEPHKDIRGWLVGVGIGGIVWLIAHIARGL